MSEEISFNNWAEASEYILENCEKSCLNCHYGNRNKITKSPFIFCIEPNNGMTMANLNFGICCSDWKKYEGDDK